MKGTWTGHYKHESNLLSEEVRNRLTKFKIEINEFDGVKFRGTVQDEITTGGTEGIGTIEGLIRNNEVSFIKQMPIKTMFLPNGNIKTTNRKHPKIYYFGIVSDDGYVVKGSWRFKIGITWIGMIPALRAPIKGTWEMKKE